MYMTCSNSNNLERVAGEQHPQVIIAVLVFKDKASMILYCCHVGLTQDIS